LDTTEEAVPAHEAVMEHPLDIGSPAAVQQILDGSQESQDEPAAKHAEAAVQAVLAMPIAASRLPSLVLFWRVISKKPRDEGKIFDAQAFAACFIAACIALQEVLAGSQVEPAATQQLLEGAGEAAAPAVEEPVQAIETVPAVAAEAAPMIEDAAEEDDDEDRLVI
jgi:hypothetical protein